MVELVKHQRLMGQKLASLSIKKILRKLSLIEVLTLSWRIKALAEGARAGGLTVLKNN